MTTTETVEFEIALARARGIDKALVAQAEAADSLETALASKKSELRFPGSLTHHERAELALVNQQIEDLDLVRRRGAAARERLVATCPDASLRVEHDRLLASDLELEANRVANEIDAERRRIARLEELIASAKHAIQDAQPGTTATLSARVSECNRDIQRGAELIAELHAWREANAAQQAADAEALAALRERMVAV